MNLDRSGAGMLPTGVDETRRSGSTKPSHVTPSTVARPPGTAEAVIIWAIAGGSVAAGAAPSRPHYGLVLMVGGCLAGASIGFLVDALVGKLPRSRLDTITQVVLWGLALVAVGGSFGILAGAFLAPWIPVETPAWLCYGMGTVLGFACGRLRVLRTMFLGAMIPFAVSWPWLLGFGGLVGTSTWLVGDAQPGALGGAFFGISWGVACLRDQCETALPAAGWAAALSALAALLGLLDSPSAAVGGAFAGVLAGAITGEIYAATGKGTVSSHH